MYCGGTLFLDKFDYRKARKHTNIGRFRLFTSAKGHHIEERKIAMTDDLFLGVTSHRGQRLLLSSVLWALPLYDWEIDSLCPRNSGKFSLRKALQSSGNWTSITVTARVYSCAFTTSATCKPQILINTSSRCFSLHPKHPRKAICQTSPISKTRLRFKRFDCTEQDPRSILKGPRSTECDVWQTFSTTPTHTLGTYVPR